MARKKAPDAPPPGAPAWTATFGDLMNLLLCFFVLLYAMSSTDSEKFEAVAASFANTFSVFQGGGSTIGDGEMVGNGISQLNNLSQYFNTMGMAEKGMQDNTKAENNSESTEQAEVTTEAAGNSDTSESDSSGSSSGQSQSDAAAEEQLKESGLKASESMSEQIEESVDEDDLSKQIDINFTSQYVSLTMNGSLLFDSGSATIKQDAVPLLQKVGKILETYAGGTIEIEGHTDNVPISNSKFANNDELSSFRALAVFEFLKDNTDLDPALMKHTGRGAYVPIADNGTPEGRQQNRRVEIKIYNQLSDAT